MKSLYPLSIICLLAAANVSAQCWQQAAAGLGHTVAIRTNGTLWAWGYNQYGQLGNGTYVSQNVPVQVGTANTWQQVSAGSTHTAAIKTDGTLWAWGSNVQGELGNGTNILQNIPVQIGTATNWQQVAAGSGATAAIKTDGTLWTWGANGNGQLGNGNTTAHNTPVQVGTSTNWQQVAIQNGRTEAIKTDGTLWTWGVDLDANGMLINHLTPVQIGTANNWQQLALGKNTHSIFLKTDGTLWAAGGNDNGQLGTGTNTTQNGTPIKIGTATNWQRAAAGLYHTVAIKTDGTLWAWGANLYGQLGNGANTDLNAPLKIGLATDWQQVAAGSEYTVAIKSDGSLWAWGYNAYGQLGIGTNADKNTPTEVACAVSSTNNALLPSDYLHISPNPAGDHIIVQMPDLKTTNVYFEVSNMLGEVIYARQRLTDKQQIDLNNLVQGVYTLIISNQEGRVAKQFVKM